MTFRRRLAHVDALPQLSLLALIAGILTGLVIVAFRLAVEIPLSLALPGGHEESFESLPRMVGFALPIGGALALGLLFSRLAPEQRSLGVTHVMERLARHQGHVPLGNALLQFGAGIVALATGQSGGREGPAIHLGAAASSLLGQRLRLPNNSIRTLVGCGTAAAIAASFNTPIAGVIFAMEVVMMEYTVVSFIPVIVASVAATLVSVAVFGGAVAFEVPPLEQNSLWETPFIILGGALLGLLAVGFMALVQRFGRYAEHPPWMRFTAAGIITGTAALVAPEILGVGYDSVDAAFVGELSLTALLLIAALKLVVSAATTGLGLPVGFIGPVVVIGALAGGALGQIGVLIWPAQASDPGFYALIGMAAMMGAVLQAPLAALMSVLELTGNPNAILPAMLAIVVANLVCSRFFGARSLFATVLEARGLTLDTDPLTLAMQRAGVASRMDRNIVRVKSRLTVEDARAAMQREPRWIVVDTPEGPNCVLAAADLLRHLEALDASAAADAAKASPASGQPEAEAPEADASQENTDADRTELLVDLLEIPGLRKDVVLLQFQATLHEAMARLKETGREAVCVTRTAAPMITPIIGVLTREDIEKHYGLRG